MSSGQVGAQEIGVQEAGARSASDWPIFLRHWIRDPLGIGALFPSSARVAQAMARQLQLDRPGVIVELGAGTGSLTRGLIAAGCPAERLIVVESEPQLTEYLAQRIPGPRAVCGDAREVGTLMDEIGVKDVATVISSLPIKWFPLEDQRATLLPCLERLGPGGSFIQLTNAWASPVQAKALGIHAKQVARIWWHFLPVQIWRYWQ